MCELRVTVGRHVLYAMQIAIRDIPDMADMERRWLIVGQWF